MMDDEERLERRREEGKQESKETTRRAQGRREQRRKVQLRGDVEISRVCRRDEEKTEGQRGDD